MMEVKTEQVEQQQEIEKEMQQQQEEFEENLVKEQKRVTLEKGQLTQQVR